MKNSTVGYTRSILFSAGFLGLLILVTPIVLLFAAIRIPYQVRFWIMARWTQFCIWWLKVTCNIDYEIIGTENIPDKPVIIFANHQSTWETLFIPQFNRRHQAWVLKQELMRVPFFGWSMSAIGTIPIVRGSGRTALKRIIDLGKKYLEAGSSVVIFPQGTRVAPGEKKPFAIGGAMLAASARDYPILPIAHNAGTFWPRKGFLKREGTVTVVIGKPIEVGDMTANQINQTIETWMYQTMASIEKNNKA